MIKIVALTLIFVLHQLMPAQLVVNPKYAYEQLSLYTKYSVIKDKYAKAKVFTVDEKTKAMAAKFSNDFITLQYYDTTLFKSAKLSFSFSKIDSLLLSVQYMLFVAPGVEEAEYEKAAENLWDETSSRFGEPASDKTVPMFGKVRNWEIGKTAIRLMKTETVLKSLMISYSIKD